MTDYFALLQQPRRPWLEEESVKKQFLALSAAAHPDRVHGASPDEKVAATQRFSELNAAYNCLKEPRDRLRHLVELELGRKPGDLKNVPTDLADMFMKIAASCQTTDRLIAERARIQSPLLQAGFFEKVQPHLDTLEQLQQQIAGLQAHALDQLQALDKAWENPSQRASVMPLLEELSQVLGFHGRWRAQLREAHFSLTL